MESWPFNAQHSGAISHAHSFHFDSTVVDALKEVRLAVSIIVIGWIAVTSIKLLPALQQPNRREGG